MERQTFGTSYNYTQHQHQQQINMLRHLLAIGRQQKIGRDAVRATVEYEQQKERATEHFYKALSK